MRINLILLTLILNGLFSAGCSTDSTASAPGREAGRAGRVQQEREEKALSVRGYRVALQPISTYVISNTTLEAVRNVTVFSRLNAIISDLKVEEGDAVQQGQLLARLDDREIRNDYEQAKIAVELATVSDQQAKVRAELSSSSYERALSLFEQKLMSREEFDQVALQNRTDTLGLDDAARQLEAANSRLEAAQIQLEYTSIYSPITGILTERFIDVGDKVNVNEALFTVLEFPPLWARIFVPERSLPELSAGQAASLKVETYPDRTFNGRIKMISPTVDASSGTVKVTIELDRPGNLLRPGMFGTVYIATDTHPEAVVVPKKAILRERDQNFIFVINADNTVTRREVTIGFSEEDRVEILQGIQDGEAIVTVGVETLNDGYPVVVQNFEGSQTPTQPRPPEPRRAETVEPQGPAGRAAGDPGMEQRGGQRARMFERMMENPEIRKRYEARLKENPDLETDLEKRRQFMRELMSEMRQRAEN